MTDTIRVLIADDDDELRGALCDVIAAQPGLELVGAASNGDEAVGLAIDQSPDVVLMDVKMPPVDGADATRRILAERVRCHIVALSAYDDRTTLLAMLRSGAVSYLVKGCGVAEIVQAIERAADGQSTLSGAVSAELVHEMAHRLQQDEQSAIERRQTLARTRDVLDGNLEIVLQPVFDLVIGAAVGVEALSRFPGDPATPTAQWFLDAAEVGLRVDLELAAIRAALVARKTLPEPLYLTVNVGPETLRSPRFTEVLDDGDLPGLVLEITEHAPIDDYDKLATILKPLRARGLRLAVDDAGAGFASLRHILRLDPEIIKLDMDLTRRLDSDRPRRALATALISFANEIGAEIIAEGVEQKPELEALRRLGVRFGQGFYLGMPAPVEVCLGTLDKLVR